MRTYLTGRPLRCIRSETFFQFQARRMMELKNLQFTMARARPPNYGTITAVIMHLIKHVTHTPIPMAAYLRDALRSLRATSIPVRFGMLFLHDLDIPGGTVREIVAEDSEGCKKDMQKARTYSVRRPVAIDSGPTAQFPIGNAPTWEDITNILHLNPTSFLREWLFSPMWHVHDQASALFIQFTVDYSCTLDRRALLAGAPQHPAGNLESAMNFWTVSSLTELLTHARFVPSNHGLRGTLQGHSHRSFVEWKEIFFPGMEKMGGLNSVWKELWEAGYIHEYHELLEDSSDEEIEELDTSLII